MKPFELWTNDDSLNAQKQGWDLFETEGVLMIQRDDEVATLPGDSEAFHRRSMGSEGFDSRRHVGLSGDGFLPERLVGFGSFHKRPETPRHPSCSVLLPRQSGRNKRTLCRPAGNCHQRRTVGTPPVTLPEKFPALNSLQLHQFICKNFFCKWLSGNLLGLLDLLS